MYHLILRYTDTNIKSNQRALICQKFPNYAQRQSEVMASPSKVVVEWTFRENARDRICSALVKVRFSNLKCV